VGKGARKKRMKPVSVQETNRLEALNLISKLKESVGDKRIKIAVFGLGSYGDALQITPFLRSLRSRFPEAKISLIHPNKAVSSLLKLNHVVDDIYIQRSASFPLLWPFLENEGGVVDLLIICRLVIEYIVPPHSLLSEDQQQFVSMAQAKQADWLPLVRAFPFDNDILWQVSSKKGMNVYALMAETSGFSGEDFENLQVVLESEDFNKRMELPDKYVVICNTAEELTLTRDKWTKTMPNSKMARILEGIKCFGIPSVLLGASTNDAPIKGVDYDWRGKTNLRQAAAILKDSVGYIAPEGGLANLARAVGRRGVVFFGSTPPEFYAYRDNINILPHRCGACWWATESYLYQCPRLLLEPECTNSISEAEVIEAFGRLIGQS
jgi:ADP-heptose:LPS heptosyltransferase